MIKTWQERCEEHPDHEGIVTEQMIRDRMQEEIDALRQAIEQAEAQDIEAMKQALEALKSLLMGTFDLATGHAATIDEALDALEPKLREVLGHLRARREWVGLTEQEIMEMTCHEGLIRYFEAKLKEKNT